MRAEGDFKKCTHHHLHPFYIVAKIDMNLFLTRDDVR